MTNNPLELFRKFFGAVRANFWPCGSFLAPDIRGNFVANEDKQRQLWTLEDKHFRAPFRLSPHSGTLALEAANPPQRDHAF